MTTIEDIKNECREIIAQAEKATKGEWIVRPGDSSDVATQNNEHGICTTYGIYATKETKRYNALFIAASRSFTPRAAKSLLDFITYIEEDLAYPPLNLRAREKLETIRRAWEESK